MPALLAEAVSVHLEADPTQRGSVLEIRLTVKNEGRQPVELVNPFDLAQFLVTDRNGFPMQLPRTAPSLLLNTKGQTEPQVRSAVPILRMQLNGRDREVTELNARVLTLGPGESYRVWYAVDRFIEDAEQVGVAPTQVPVPSGEYSIECIVTLINASDTKDARVVHTPRVKVQLAA